MSAVNPYEKFLDDRPVEAILSITPEELERLLAVIGEKRVNAAPEPGKWSAAQVLAHLADCELVFAFRLRQTLAEDAPTIQPFDQDKWAATYTAVPPAQALGVFKALRGWNLRLINLALPQAAQRPVTHPERGTMTFLTIVETMAGHDLNHLAQLERIGSSD